MFSTPSSPSHLSIIFLSTILFIFINPSQSSIQSFIYDGCSQQKYTQGTPYESNVNSLLNSLINSASYVSFNNLNSSVPGSTLTEVAYGLFQCRGDLRGSNCRDCVVGAVSQLGVLCGNSTSGALQLEGCYVKYDSVSFVGVDDKTLVMKKCGPSISLDSEELIPRDAVLGHLRVEEDYFRVSGSRNVQGVAQCMEDLSGDQCQDCLSEAIGRLKVECGPAMWGDIFLGKCYTRYFEQGAHSKTDNDEDEKTLAILIGLMSGVVLLIIFLSFLSKLVDNKGGK
ncbi:plasmodesmata-located protein 6-like isoform X2 [Impatiens glandulifera]|uniref:plasmodesmata-located protein 6-like isoform X2 n=1 Tax=Impatiens glandulifera TaxID=253017 RepID=UPI001FB16268|nr:plasmodesmata-located protein 6-like isoform X2 [Impatiens glandulifera]